MALKGLDIFKLSPKKNCKECGSPTCMAFCMKVAQGALPIEKCPYMSDEAIALLSEATAPPMKAIEVGGMKLGGETVMMRHEKTFVNRNRFAVSLCTCMDDAAVDAKLAEMKAVDYERIGEREYVEFLLVHDGGDGARLADLCKKAAATERAVIIDTDSVDNAKLALAAIGDTKPVLNGANKDNYEAMSALAVEAGVVLGVKGADLAEIHDTVAALEKLENKNLSHLPVVSMSHHTMGMYALYMATLGNYPDLFAGKPHASQLKEPMEYEVPEAYKQADPKFAKLIEVGERYIGYPYVWGGDSPETSFDCSGFISWIFKESGVRDVGRLGATSLYGVCTPIEPEEARPGDLIFFQGTLGDGVAGNDGITHVALYVGDGYILNCGNPISYADLSRAYWQEHFYGFGRMYE